MFRGSNYYSFKQNYENEISLPFQSNILTTFKHYNTQSTKKNLHNL